MQTNLLTPLKKMLKIPSEVFFFLSFSLMFLLGTGLCLTRYHIYLSKKQIEDDGKVGTHIFKAYCHETAENAIGQYTYIVMCLGMKKGKHQHECLIHRDFYRDFNEEKKRWPLLETMYELSFGVILAGDKSAW